MEHALNQQEDIKSGIKNPLVDLISSYRNGLNGNLEASIEDTNFIGFEIDDMESLTDQEKILASNIEDYFQQTILEARNARMASSVLGMLDQNPGTSFFFAFGAAHFLGKNNIFDYLEAANFTITPIGLNELRGYTTPINGAGMPSPVNFLVLGLITIFVHSVFTTTKHNAF